MSLLEALAEAVVNVSAAKGGEGRIRNNQGSSDSLFGQASTSEGGNLEDILGSILSGQSQRPAPGGRASDGLGGLLEQLAGASNTSDDRSRSGLDDIIGQLSSNKGGLGDLLGAVTKAMAGADSGGRAENVSFGDMLNQAISNRGSSSNRPSPSVAQEVAAGLMLRAMIQAAKADGKFDQKEQTKLLGRLGDVSADERKFVSDELARPVDVAGLANDVPRGLEHQVYAMSVMGIDLDNQAEARYLHDLSQSLRLDKVAVNQVHAKLGAPALYR